MNNLYQIGNALSVYGVIASQEEWDHVTMEKNSYYIKIIVFADYDEPKLYDLKKELIKVCTEKCSFEFRHFEANEDSEAFSTLNLTWEL